MKQAYIFTMLVLTAQLNLNSQTGSGGLDKNCNVYISGDFASNTFILANDTLVLSGSEASFIGKLSLYVPDYF
jgi:hypothetical protein